MLGLLPLSIASLLLPLLVAADDITCRTFIPNPDRSTWNFKAYTAGHPLSVTANCINPALPCPVSTSSPPERLSWSTTFDIPKQGIQPDVRDSNITSVVGEPYADEVSTAEAMTLFVPLGQKGYLSVAAQAVEVRGWFEECGDGGRYEGRALVPNARGVTFGVVLHS